MADQERTRSVAEKLEAIRIAARYEFPTAGIDTMLAEIEAGYGTAETSPEPFKIEPCKD
jgi:hypothetical protein